MKIPRSLLALAASLLFACSTLESEEIPALALPMQDSVPVMEAVSEDTVHAVLHEASECELCSLYERLRAGTFVVRAGRSLGTAVLLARGGFAVTNAHVVGDHDLVEIVLSDGSTYSAEVRAKDRAEDLALLSIGELPDSAVVAELDLTVPRIGSEVYAIGHPLGLGWSLSRGIISGRPIINGRPMVQTDAPISPGNSGGPLIDEHGHVVGIITEKVAERTAESLAFARPIETVVRFLERSGVTVVLSPEEGL